MRKRYISLFIVFLAVSAFAFSSCGILGGGDSETTTPSSAGEVPDLVDQVMGSSDSGTVEEDPSAPLRPSEPVVLTNSADGTYAFSGNGATVDFTHINEGYIMAKYEGDNPKIKLQITEDGGETYTYDIVPNIDYTAFPIQESGNYTIAVFLNVEGDKYTPAAQEYVAATLTDEFTPYIRPNQYVEFNASSLAVAKGAELSAGTRSDLKAIENIFMWIIANVSYDYDLAATVQSGYLPDVDTTLRTGKGICFDYAALMTCMLRSQGIPCRLVIGYAGSAYHAWISVHVDGIGWVDNMIQFSGDTWTRMDPTFASSGDRTDPNMIGDGETYSPMYYY